MPMRLNCDRLFPVFNTLATLYMVASLSARVLYTYRLKLIPKFPLRMVHQCRAPDCCSSGPVAGKKEIFDYKQSVKTLNALQSNAAVLEKARINPDLEPIKNIPNAIVWLACLGITLEDLDKLNVIHVSGTKGKGSTCAFCEAIMRKHGLRTGFYSSPHIVAVRERIRINGRPLSENVFASYFWEVYDRLKAAGIPTSDIPFPAYFGFLTLLSFHVFLKEKVDVAIVEVGIGGQYDTTNVIRNPVVCGVTSLGMDHLAILGPTLVQIAWQKAGIFKAGVPAVTVQQKEEAMEILVERANKIGARLTVAPPLESHSWNGLPVILGLSGETQKINASLAVQLVLSWFQQRGYSLFPGKVDQGSFHDIPNHDLMCSISAGLSECHWPGRYQVLRINNNVIYFLDGAHTPESMQTCVRWFDKASKSEAGDESEHVFRILLFNSTGDRSAESLLSPLSQSGFDLVIFCPNNITTTYDSSSDVANLMTSREKLLERCEFHQKVWFKLITRDSKCHTTNGTSHVPVMTTPCISDAITLLATKRESLLVEPPSAINTSNSVTYENKSKMHILVVGSLHLVGGVLNILNPDLENL